MKRTIKIAAIAVTALAIGAWACKVAAIREYVGRPSDVFFYTLFLFEDTTTFSPKYSEAEFRTIRVGDTQEQVKAKLGEPVSMNRDEEGKVWFYSNGQVDRNFWARTLVLDRTGHVRGGMRYYFVD